MTVVFVTFLICIAVATSTSVGPVVVNTWPFTAATKSAFDALSKGASALDGIETGCTTCEVLQCDGTVGYGGSPDESGETTLDAMIMDGVTMEIGAVANLRRVKNAIGVARAVMKYTTHTLLAGNQAKAFALSMGFQEESLTTNASINLHQGWLANNCQPNYRRNVLPDPYTSCGPYKPNELLSSTYSSSNDHQTTASLARPERNRWNHDTIGIVTMDLNGTMAAGTSTNGARNKVPGRVGDSPIPGAGSYVDSDVGGCGATGDGDVMMRFLPCYQSVENLRRGMSPKQAAEDAMRRIMAKYPAFQGGIVVLSKTGEHAGAAHGWNFSYSFQAAGMIGPQVVAVIPLSL